MLKILRHWPAAALAVSIAMLATAHGFETIGGLAPCHLCLKQREVYWAAAAVGLVGACLDRFGSTKRHVAWIDLVLAVVFLGGAALAAFHAGVEWKWWPGPASCTGAGGGADIGDITAMMNGAKLKPPACDQAAWRMLGLSMAGWNVLISLGLAAASLLAARQERKA